MYHGIFNKRLDEEFGNGEVFQPRLQITLKRQALAKADLLQAEIIVNKGKLFPQGSARVMLASVAEQVGEPNDGLLQLPFFSDPVQGDEQV